MFIYKQLKIITVLMLIVFKIEGNEQMCPKNSYACKVIKHSLNRDIKRCPIHFKKVELFERNILGGKKIRGQMKYYGVWGGKYAYDISKLSNDEIVLTTKVHFKDLKKYPKVVQDDFLYRLRGAAVYWEMENPYIFQIKFNIEVTIRENAYFKDIDFVKLTRGPYYLNWNPLWSMRVMAHEIGHFFGLDDEYTNFFGPECDKFSLMCHSDLGLPQPYHYYLILRRAFCV